MRAWIAIGAVCAMAAGARAEPPSDEDAVAVAQRFETGPRLCKAMNRATRSVSDCSHAALPPRVHWSSDVRGNTRVVKAFVGQESIWIITLVIDARGRAVSESTMYSYGGP